MKRTIRKFTILSAIALSVGGALVFLARPPDSRHGQATAHADDGSGQARGGGGGRGPGGGGDQKNQGGGPRGHAGSGGPASAGAVPPSSRGAIHSPPAARVRSAPSGGGQPFVNRTPALSHPTARDFHPPTQRAIADHPPATRIRPPAHVETNRSGAVAPLQGHGARVGGLQHPANRAGDQPPRSHANHSAIVNRPFTGNTVRLYSRDIHVAHTNYQPAYYRHSGYHGYWNGNHGFTIGNSGVRIGLGNNFGFGGGYGPGWGWGLGNGYGVGGLRSYRYRPFGWGLGGWGLGSLIYSSGYLGYQNPYYVISGPAVYNYSLPIPVVYNAKFAIAPEPGVSADEILSSAIAKFKLDDYSGALAVVDKGIGLYPDDAVLHEFRALTLFAKQDYQQAAATIHSVLAVGPGWDWTTLSGMYDDVATYAEHSRALEAYADLHPRDAAARFLLAYHYVSCGHADAAARQLQTVVALQPDDRVAADLLRLIDASRSEPPTAPAPAARVADESPRLAAKPIDLKTMVGVWKAGRADGSTFELALRDDETFMWSFALKNQPPQKFEGTYSAEEDLLVLERKDGGSLIAQIVAAGPAKFTFKLVGAPDDDKGLVFSRTPASE